MREPPHIADTGLFVAIRQPSNSRYGAVRRFAHRNDITFVLLERVYREVTVDDLDVEDVPVDTAIDEGWRQLWRRSNAPSLSPRG